MHFKILVEKDAPRRGCICYSRPSAGQIEESYGFIERYGRHLAEDYADRPAACSALDSALRGLKKSGAAVNYTILMEIMCDQNFRDLPGLIYYRGRISILDYILGISGVDPAPAHYACTKCFKSLVESGGDGLDLPERPCPSCSGILEGSGHGCEEELCWVGGRRPPFTLLVTERSLAQIRESMSELKYLRSEKEGYDVIPFVISPKLEEAERRDMKNGMIRGLFPGPLPYQYRDMARRIIKSSEKLSRIDAAGIDSMEKLIRLTALRFGLFDRDPGELLEDESALLTEDDVFRLIAGKGLDRDAAAAETRKIARGGYDPERHDAFFEDRSPEGRGIRYLWTRAECVSHLYEQALIYGGSDGKQALQ